MELNSLMNNVRTDIYYEGSPFEKLGEGAKYEELFVTAMKNHGILCIGLYRLNIIVYYCLVSLFFKLYL
jgi:hypothetical protein